MGSASTTAPKEGTGRFAAQLTPPAHIMTFYETDQEFFDIVTEFVTAGIAAGDSVVVVATTLHLQGLSAQFARLHIDLVSARAGGRYIELDINDVYDTLFAKGRPDEDCFDVVMEEAERRKGLPGRAIRCVSEIASVLWARGAYETAIRLEQREQVLSDAERLVILCLYSRAAFEQDRAFGRQAMGLAHKVYDH